MGAHKAALCPSHCATAPAPGMAAGCTRMAGTRELQHRPLLSWSKHSPAPHSAAVPWQQGEGCARLSNRTSQLGTDSSFCSPCAPHGRCSGLEGQISTASCEPCPAGPVLCLTCKPGACQTQQLPSILGSTLGSPLAAAWAGSSSQSPRDVADLCCGMGDPSRLPAPSTSTDISKGHPTRPGYYGGTLCLEPSAKGPPFSSAQPHPHQGNLLSPQPSPTLREPWAVPSALSVPTWDSLSVLTASVA